MKVGAITCLEYPHHGHASIAECKKQVNMLRSSGVVGASTGITRYTAISNMNTFSHLEADTFVKGTNRSWLEGHCCVEGTN